MRHGDPRLPARFWNKTAVNAAGCWLWTASLKRDGYGEYWHDGRVARAHIVAYEVLVGPIGPGDQHDHTCRVRHCVNPAHLDPVTQRENILRGVGPTALHAAATRCINGHPFDIQNTRVRRDGARSCRACDRDRKRAWRAGRSAA